MHDNSNGAVTNTTIVIAILQCYKGILFDLYTHVVQGKVIQKTQVIKIFWSELLLTLLNTDISKNIPF